MHCRSLEICSPTLHRIEANEDISPTIRSSFNRSSSSIIESRLSNLSRHHSFVLRRTWPKFTPLSSSTDSTKSSPDDLFSSSSPGTQDGRVTAYSNSRGVDPSGAKEREKLRADRSETYPPCPTQLRRVIYSASVTSLWYAFIYLWTQLRARLPVKPMVGRFGDRSDPSSSYTRPKTLPTDFYPYK
jgi:hypothetical protein